MLDLGVQRPVALIPAGDRLYVVTAGGSSSTSTPRFDQAGGLE